MKFLTAALFGLYVAVAWSHVLVEQENDRLKDRIAYLEAQSDPVHVEVSHYTACRTETNDDPANTALMERPVVGRTVAVSHDLKHLLGKTVYVEGYGVRRVNDLMARRWERRIDVLVGSKEEARQRGVVGPMQIVELR